MAAPIQRSVLVHVRKTGIDQKLTVADFTQVILESVFQKQMTCHEEIRISSCMSVVFFVSV